MTQMPPPPGYVPPVPYGTTAFPPARPTNALAVVSLVCGLIGCFVITPLVAIVTGLLGLSKAKRIGTGRGMAVAGIILGVLWIVGGLAVGGATYWGVHKLADLAKGQALGTINALVDGDIAKAQQMSSMDEATTRALSDQLKDYGHCTGLSLGGINSSKNNGKTEIHGSGTATFEKAGTKGFSAVVTNAGPNGALTLSELHVD